MAKDGIIKGYPDGTFKGNRPMTRYEAAVLAYRAVDMIEAQITAGKAVEKADIDAANKMMAAFGAELKAVERHVDALQKQADATDKALGTTSALGCGHRCDRSASADSCHDLVPYHCVRAEHQRQQRPAAGTVNGVVYAPGTALPGGIGTAPTGVSAAGSSTVTTGPVIVALPGAGPAGGIAWGPQPMYVMGQNTQHDRSVRITVSVCSIMSAELRRQPRRPFAVARSKLTNLDRYSATNFYPQATPSALHDDRGRRCRRRLVPRANTEPARTPTVILTNFVRLQDMWYQYTTPGGIAIKVGKFVQDEGPKQTQLPRSGASTTT